MDNEEFDFLGWYDLGFLHLRVNTAEEIFDLNRLYKSSDPNKVTLLSTFLHEYIHFLQEITTISGVHLLGLNIDFLKNVIGEVRHDGQATFKVPFEYSNKYNAIANQELIKIYKGDNKSVDYALYAYYSKEDVVVQDKDGRELKPGKYFVYYNGKGGGQDKIHFGSVCLKEFVTHTLQSKFDPTLTHSDVPYTIAGEIIKKECPSFGDDPMQAVALCDASLMDIHPARTFFRTIERIKEINFKPSSNSSVYDFVYGDLNFVEQ